MNTIGTFSDLVGFYVLTPEGQLGFYDQDNKFFVDAKLTKAFGEYNTRYLMAYLRDPEQGSFRLALIHRTREKKPWGSDTLFLLEKHIVRRLYPVTGMTAEVDLTAFQKKNREKSIYRGMELFLEYKDGSNPDMPIFCPVLYDRGTTLDKYALNLDRQVTSVDRETPVVEVINILAAIPIPKRYSREIAVLKQKIYQGIVKKGMRKSAEFTLIDDIRRNAETAKAGQINDPYGDIDKRADRQVTLNTATHSNKAATGSASDSMLIKNIGSALLGHPEPADSMTLKAFAKFRDLDRKKLEALAAQCPIYKVPPGTQLLERGTSDTWNLYLLDGTLQLMAADGKEKLVDGGTNNASNPISSLKPRMYTVTSVTWAAFLWIDDKLVEDILKEKTTPMRLDDTA